MKELAHLSGSARHFFDLSNITTDIFKSVKKSVGDIDTMVDVSKKKEPTPDMAKEDFKLLEKFSLLDNRDKETILSMIDVMLSRKEKSED